MALNFRSTPAHAILMMLAGWIHREQDAVVAYQREEIRALREMLGGKRLRFTDAQRRRLALKARPLSHTKLPELGARVTPDTLTRWLRKYAGAKYDSHRGERVQSLCNRRLGGGGGSPSRTRLWTGIPDPRAKYRELARFRGSRGSQIV